MGKQYKVVHFVPDPFSGTRLPVAALVEGNNGRVQLTRAPHLPGPDCLGRPTSEEVLLMALDALEDADSLRALPLGVGPHVVLDVGRQIPADVSDPAGWVEKHVLPQRPERRHAPRATRSYQRATWGYRFFEQHEVSEYVNKTFEPDRDLSLFASPVGDAIQKIAHWVGDGGEGLLLMEPILPGRQLFDVDLREVGTKFGAYRFQLETNADAATRARTKLVAYLLAGGSEAKRREAFDALRATAHEVVDTASETPRRQFVEQIKDLGLRSRRQPALT